MVSIRVTSIEEEEEERKIVLDPRTTWKKPKTGLEELHQGLVRTVCQ
jgi:hypothetical protein